MNKHSKYRPFLDDIELSIAGGHLTVGTMYQIMLQKLDSIENEEGELKAQAITDLISECAYANPVDGTWMAIIDVDSAIKYADRLGEG